MTAAAKKLPGAATLADLLAAPEEDRYELVDGELLPKEAARGPHGRAQVNIGISIGGPFGRRPTGGPPERPGGWWFASEVLVQLAPRQIRRPDLAGWRRERMPAMPTETPIILVPDWICEVLSSNRAVDLIEKMSLYHQAQVPHYWIVDPEEETLAVYRWHPDGFLHVLGARRGQRVRPEPFGAVELSVGAFFGEDED
jgi:Uma2 family endonuclease